MKNLSPEQSQLLENAVSRPVFIVGTMRSGTSFLGQSLNEAESLIGCPFELRRVWSRAGRVPMASDVGDETCPCLDASNMWLGQERALKDAFKQEMVNNLHTKTLTRNSRFLNKCPHLCNKLGLVDALFSQAHYLWTIRPLKEVVQSLNNLFQRPFFRQNDYFHLWPYIDGKEEPRCFSVLNYSAIESNEISRAFPGGDIQFLAEYWLESNLAVAKHFRAIERNRTLCVRHEDVIQKPHETAKNIERSLGLSRGQAGAVFKDSDSALTKQWDFNLKMSEELILAEFSETHSEAINFINEVAAQCSHAG